MPENPIHPRQMQGERIDSLGLRALEQVREVGKRGLQVKIGWESVTQARLVEQGHIYQEHGNPGHWKFTLSRSGERALAAHGEPTVPKSET